MILGLLGSGFAWLLGKGLSLATSGVVQKALGVANAATDGKVKLAQIDANTGVAVFDKAADAGTDRQKAKFNVPVFVVMLAATLGAPLTLFWSITIYNILFWQNGIWPQDWSIAAYPPSVAHWAEMAMQWLFDPLGPPSAVGAAGAAGYIMGRRK